MPSREISVDIFDRVCGLHPSDISRSFCRNFCCFSDTGQTPLVLSATTANPCLKSQLDECLRVMPELIDNSEFITTYLSKLAPSDDADISYDPAERKTLA